MQRALPARRHLRCGVHRVLTADRASSARWRQTDPELRNRPEEQRFPPCSQKLCKNTPTVREGTAQPCSVRRGRARCPRGSAPRGPAAGPVHPGRLLLLRQGLPLLPVLPAAVQQGEAVLGHVRQGLGRETKGAAARLGPPPPPGPAAAPRRAGEPGLREPLCGETARPPSPSADVAPYEPLDPPPWLSCFSAKGFRAMRRNRFFFF